VAVGACAALRDDDYVTSTHRPHGHCLAKAWDVKRTMAEMMGRETGLSRGRGGSMHQFERCKGFLGGNGIVGGGIALALGAAFAARYQGTDQVALGFFSEGASNQGVLHESLNMAALWKLPLVYVCENNRWAATTPVEKSTCTPDIAPRAAAFGLPWQIVDGNSVLEVYAAVNEAVARARAGGGTTFIEAKTYRVEPHCGIIADRRDQGELNRWRGDDHDPIARFEACLIEAGEADREVLDIIQCEVEEALVEAIEFARQSPFPEPAQVGDALWA
jgi:TPP-dependent pyruvate/acetoin dehydrogenase alpha subunit